MGRQEQDNSSSMHPLFNTTSDLVNSAPAVGDFKLITAFDSIKESQFLGPEPISYVSRFLKTIRQYKF